MMMLRGAITLSFSMSTILFFWEAVAFFRGIVVILAF